MLHHVNKISIEVLSLLSSVSELVGVAGLRHSALVLHAISRLHRGLSEPSLDAEGGLACK